MTTTTTRPCWNCGTRHESDTVPALCSDPCREVWRGLYQLAYAAPAEILDGPIHPGEVQAVVSAASLQPKHGCDPEPAQHQYDEHELDNPEYLELEQHQIAAERAERGNRALQAQAPGLVLSLYKADELGYLAASDEWVNGNGWPLIEPLQLAATKLALDGQLPRFAEWFPAPSEDICPPRPPEPPTHSPQHAPWWKRVFRRG